MSTASSASGVPAHFLWGRWVLANAAGWGVGGIAGRMAAALVGTAGAAILGSAAASPSKPGGVGSLFFAVVGAMVAVTAIAAGGAVAGTIVGIMQGRIVGPHLRSTVHWIAATIEGTAIGVLVGATVTPLAVPVLGVVGDSMHRPLPQPVIAGVVTRHGAQMLAWAIIGVAIGTFVGLAQQAILYKERGGTGRWALANLIGWGVAGLAASVSATPATLDQGFGSGWELRRIVDGLAGLVIFGLVAGTVGGGITGTVLARLFRTAGK